MPSTNRPKGEYPYLHPNGQDLHNAHLGLKHEHRTPIYGSLAKPLTEQAGDIAVISDKEGCD